MQDRPDLSEQALAAALRRHYAIDAVSVGFVSGGQDASAWVYRVETGPPSARYLLKVREAKGSRDVAAAVSRHLCERGVGHVVAPVRSNTGSLWVQEGDFSFTVYPFIAGRAGVEAGLVERHWLALGKLVRRLHASPRSETRAVPTPPASLWGCSTRARSSSWLAHRTKDAGSDGHHTLRP